MKRLLLLSTTTGYQAQQFRAAAEHVGIPLVLATDSCHALDDPWGDGAISVRFQKPRESAVKIREFAQHHPIHGVVAIGDAPTVTAAVLAEELGLRFHSPASVELCRNKFLARERYKQAGLRLPWYTRFKTVSDPVQAAKAVPYPCVLKPLGLSASRGVIRADDARQFAAAFRRIVALLQQKDVKIMRQESAGWLQVESFIPGREVALEGLVSGGRLRALALFDKPDPLDGPFFEETIYVTPSRLSDAAQQAIAACAQQAVSALGLDHGPVHVELRINDEGPWILEVAARPIGGLCAGALRFVGDTERLSLEELILRHALGESVENMAREAAASGVMMIPIPQEGAYEGVENVDAAEQVAGVERVEITAKLQQKLVPLPEGASYLGFIFARAEAPEMVEIALREAHRRLRFLIASPIPVL